jgi:hypothetical protein
MTDYRIRVTIISFQTKVNSFLGFLAAGFLWVFGRKRTKVTTEDLKRAEFKASTQRLGIRFSEKIRDVFRFKWLRKRKFKD